MRWTGVFEPVAVEILDVTVGGAAHDERRNLIKHPPRLAFSFDQLRFGLLAVLNVGDRSVPAGDCASLMANWRRSEQKPAVRAIVSAQPCLRIDRRAGRDIFTPDVDEPIKIIRVDAQLPAPATHLLWSRSSVLEPAFVELLHIAIGAGPPSNGGDRVQGIAQLAFSVGEPGLASTQNFVTLRAVDGDASDIGELRDEIELQRGRSPRLALIEGKRTQHLAGLRRQRRRPARPQAMPLRERTP